MERNQTTPTGNKQDDPIVAGALDGSCETSSNEKHHQKGWNTELRVVAFLRGRSQTGLHNPDRRGGDKATCHTMNVDFVEETPSHKPWINEKHEWSLPSSTSSKETWSRIHVLRAWHRVRPRETLRSPASEADALGEKDENEQAR